MKIFNKCKKLVVIAFVAIMVALLLPTDVAQAVPKKPSLNASEGVVYKYTSDSISVKNVPDGVERISWKSSNTRVVRVKSYSKIGRDCLLTPFRTGTATVTCTITTFEGKEYTLKCKITVKRGKPFSKVTVGGKNVYKSTRDSFDLTTTKSRLKTTVKVKKGWELIDSEYDVYRTATDKTTKNIPNSKKVYIGAYKTVVRYTARNEDTGASFTYSVNIYKNASKSSKPKFAKKSGTMFLKTKSNTLSVSNTLPTDTITWTSSKPKIANIARVTSDGNTATIKLVKKGKSAITCKVVRGKKTYTLKYNLTVKKRVNPFESIEVDGDDITDETSSNYYSMKVRDYSMRVQSSENSGWRIISEKYIVYKTPTIFGTETAIKGKGDVPIGTYKTTCLITAKRSSTGETYTFTLDIFNKNYKK